jgi:hydroxyacyl-ACP dehydratase HTD2-like protein with hotdog domain
VKLDLKRILHGGQEYVFHGPPPRAGQELTAQTRVEEIYEKEGKRGGTMTFVVTVQEFRDETGRLVAEARSTAIQTGKPATQEAS